MTAPIIDPIDTGSTLPANAVTTEGTCPRCGAGPRALVRVQMRVHCFDQALGLACAECVTDLVVGADVMGALGAQVYLEARQPDGTTRAQLARAGREKGA